MHLHYHLLDIVDEDHLVAGVVELLKLLQIGYNLILDVLFDCVNFVTHLLFLLRRLVIIAHAAGRNKASITGHFLLALGSKVACEGVVVVCFLFCH